MEIVLKELARRLLKLPARGMRSSGPCFSWNLIHTAINHDLKSPSGHAPAVALHVALSDSHRRTINLTEMR